MLESNRIESDEQVVGVEAGDVEVRRIREQWLKRELQLAFHVNARHEQEVSRRLLRC